MQTPYLPHALFREDFLNVYEPAEDTFLLLDALELNLSSFIDDARICVECGSGSGVVITALSKALTNTGTKQQKDINRFMLSTDINIEACKTTQKCAMYHGQHNIQIVRTNLLESLVDRLHGSVDLLVFNPPYVPTDESEHVASSSQIHLSWAGGQQGRSLIDTFLKDYVPKLLSKPKGVVYMVALESNNIPELLDCLVEEHNIQGTQVLERQAGIEHLHVLSYRWIN